MAELIFIYNAKSGVTNSLFDWAHKIISPNTYDCNLCTITYNNLGKEKKWSNFLENINIESRFYYKDHLKELHFVKGPSELPCIYLKTDNNITLIIDSDELNSFNNVEELIKKLENYLIKYDKNISKINHN